MEGGSPLPLFWAQVIYFLRFAAWPLGQNRHSKRVTAKIVFLKELQGNEKIPANAPGFSLISITTTIADSGDLIGNSILFRFCWLGDLGLDKENAGSRERCLVRVERAKTG
jgi:hypothetical protein